MFRRIVPVLHVSSSTVAERFYCGGLGFYRDFAYRPDSSAADPCYLGLRRDGLVLHASSFAGDGTAGGVVNIGVDDLDALHAELSARAVSIELPPTEQSWGEREMHVKDPDDNVIRFVQSKAGNQ